MFPSHLRRFSLKQIRFTHKLNKKPPIQKSESADVINYLVTTPEYQDLKENIPKALLRKYQTPESMYLINRKTAKEIANKIKTHINEDSPVIEVNPGFGILSRELLKYKLNHLCLFEISNNFSLYLSELEKSYPGIVTYKVANFLGMWKLAFQDKIDNGNRVKDLLGALATDKNDRMVTIIGSTPGLSFVKHLIYNTVFHDSTRQLGRPNLFLIMPGDRYEYLADSEVQITKFQSMPALFQLLFDFKILGKVPKTHFLPWTYPSTNKRVTMMDENSLYLVNITQKEKLPCAPDYLPLLWYFCKPNIFSKTKRVIPMLEEWISGCGVWFITGQDPPDTNKELSPDEHDAELPHMTIFTEFGDLTLKQRLTVFKRFISWPKFEKCQFRSTVESKIQKSVSPVDKDDKNTIETPINDMEHSDAENETSS